jgi:hypothetical protein
VLERRDFFTAAVSFYSGTISSNCEKCHTDSIAVTSNSIKYYMYERKPN